MRALHAVFRFAGILGALMCLGALASAQDQALIDAGEQLYDENCAQCHGEKLRNTGTTFDLRKFRAEDRPRFNKFVLEGKGQMPEWQGTLSDKDIDALWAYVRAHAFDK
jgi:mono/diheme cytochrome c family protein